MTCREVKQRTPRILGHATMMKRSRSLSSQYFGPVGYHWDEQLGIVIYSTQRYACWYTICNFIYTWSRPYGVCGHTKLKIMELNWIITVRYLYGAPCRYIRRGFTCTRWCHPLVSEWWKVWSDWETRKLSPRDEKIHVLPCFTRFRLVIRWKSRNIQVPGHFFPAYHQREENNWMEC